MSMKGLKGKIKAVCISEKKGTDKKNIHECEIVEGFGLKNDAHGGNWHRQISLLSYEKIEDFKKRGGEVIDGSFGENLIVSGLDLVNIPIGTKLKINDIVLEVTQIGKECHSHCEIFKKVGDCIMPREGIFAKVISGGIIKEGDIIEII
ncbi:MAG: MOSC domain-containing protein [Fusobacterium perfoetens]|uniref:MOSC domain-containing protein n=1 Tax=Fusobacterium perfoetens TaxID=852 RepID=UPI0023F396A8|nr:MOSC domain-containing protein [Fusobacterium perfoetens]MCI6152620.1 MOSC domain-containing protein [Fusobacterium perfoetens]MDY3237627.1 MOSC domain-containing protein [Fusobacterium perfoetens]